MKKLTLYVTPPPLVGGPFESSVTLHAGGYTRTDSLGAWWNDAGKRVERENVSVYQILVDSDAIVRDILELHRDYAIRAGESAIAYDIHEVTSSIEKLETASA